LVTLLFFFFVSLARREKIDEAAFKQLSAPRWPAKLAARGEGSRRSKLGCHQAGYCYLIYVYIISVMYCGSKSKREIPKAITREDQHDGRCFFGAMGEAISSRLVCFCELA